VCESIFIMCIPYTAETWDQTGQLTPTFIRKRVKEESTPLELAEYKRKTVSFTALNIPRLPEILLSYIFNLVLKVMLSQTH